jgi:vacuolar-type H+-ATPase subunit E/Vma4
MPLEKLEKRIVEEGERKAHEIEEEGRRKAEAIIKEAEAKASQISSAADAEANREIERMAQEETENAKMQENELLLDARNKAIEKVMHRLRGMTVKRVKKLGYEKMINSAISEANMVSPSEALTLSISRNDAKLVKGFSGRIRYESVGNGVVLANRSGTVKITATVEGLFEKNRPEIETMLIEEAFSQKRSTPKTRRVTVKSAKAKARKRRR